MSHYHAVVWIDHREAHVMHPAKPHQHLHNKRGADKGGAVGDGRAPEDQNFYHEVVEALKGAQEILIVGPASAKLNLVKHIHRHDQQMVDKVVGVESADHPSDAQLVVYARKYFVAADRMRP
jgi:stalled ribosome rescue protein Dom34